MAKRFFVRDGRVRPILRVLAYLILIVVGIPFLSILAALGWMALGHPRPDPSDQKSASLYFTVCAPIVAIVFALALRRFLDRRSISSLGISLRGRWYLLLAVGLAFGVLSQMARIFWLMGQGKQFITGTSLGDTAAIAAYGISSGFVIIALTALSSLAVDVAIRGYVFQNLWEQWGVIPAITASVMFDLFTGLGFQISGDRFGMALVVVALSIFLGMSIVWTGSLWFALGFHFAWDAMLNTAQLQSNTGLYLLMLGICLILLYLAHRQGMFGGETSREAYARRTAG